VAVCAVTLVAMDTIIVLAYLTYTYLLPYFVVPRSDDDDNIII